MNPEARKKGGFMFSKLGRPAGGAGMNKPGKKQGKKAFFSQGGVTTVAERERMYMDPTKLEDEDKAKAAATKAKTSEDDFEVTLDADKTKRRTNLSQFGAAFAAARARGDKNFEYRGDEKHKKGSYNTNLEKNKPAPKAEAAKPAPKAEAAKPAPKAEAAKPAPKAAKPAPKAEAAKPAPRAATPASGQPRKRATMLPTYADSRRITDLGSTIKNGNLSPERKEEMSAERTFLLNKYNLPRDSSPKPDTIRNSATLRDASRMRDLQETMSGVGGSQLDPEIRERMSGELTFLRNKHNLAAPKFAKGGTVESKKMMKKEVAFMKKKGAPKSMVKHEEAEAKGMKCGGMAKYARGGGVEIKGKTKGSMIKMASGGSVSSRADGIAVKGKTNCKIC